MKLLFIDETEIEIKKEKYFAICAVLMDASFYCIFRKKFDAIFANLGWDKKIEFKGRYLFSKKGDSTIEIEDRKSFIKYLFEQSKSKQNSRFKIIFQGKKAKKSAELYRDMLSKILKKIKPTGKGKTKSLMAVFLDYDEHLKNRQQINSIVKNNLSKKWTILERPLLIDSDNLTMGVFLADIFAYLKANVEFTSEPSNDFEEEIKKSDYMKQLINNIKEM